MRECRHTVGVIPPRAPGRASENAEVQRPQRTPRAFRIGTLALALAGVGHVGGHAMLMNDFSATGSAYAVGAAMRSTTFELAGIRRSLLDAMTGFSLCIVLFPIALAVVLTLCARALESAHLSMPRTITWAAAASSAVATAIATVYLPAVAVAFLALAATAFAVSAVQQRARMSPHAAHG